MRAAAWTWEPPLPAEDALPSALRTAPEPVVRWVSSFSLLSNADDTVWFLSRDDYAGRADSAFAWDELERLSAEAAATDAEADAVSRFWKCHLPILLSVRDGYEYLAVRDDGAVVHGTEPEFEETDVVCAQFEDLLAFIIARPSARNDVVDRLLFDGTSLSETTRSS